MCICSLSYPAHKAHAPYCHLWPVQLYDILPHYLINDTVSGEKKVIEHKMCVLIVSTIFVWNISHSKKNWTRYDHICILVFLYSTSYSCHILWNLSLLNRFLKNTQIWNFTRICFGGCQGAACKWLDRQTDMTKLIVAYASVSQPLWDRGPVNSFFIRWGPGPNKFTRKYFSNFFKFIY